VLIDQFSKYLIRLRQPVDDGFYICNKDIAWGIKVNDMLFWIIWSIIIITVSFILYKTYRKQLLFDTLCLILILAGATSNFIDRIAWGCIIDFIDLKFWPVFNLADAFIVLGGVSLLVKYLKS